MADGQSRWDHDRGQEGKTGLDKHGYTETHSWVRLSKQHRQACRPTHMQTRGPAPIRPLNLLCSLDSRSPLPQLVSLPDTTTNSSSSSNHIRSSTSVTVACRTPGGEGVGAGEGGGRVGVMMMVTPWEIDMHWLGPVAQACAEDLTQPQAVRFFGSSLRIEPHPVRVTRVRLGFQQGTCHMTESFRSGREQRC